MCNKILKIKAKNLTLHFCQGRAAIIPSSPSQQSCNQKNQGVDISGHPRIGPISELAKPRGVFVHNVSLTTATSALTALHFYNLYSSAGQCSVFCDKRAQIWSKERSPYSQILHSANCSMIPCIADCDSGALLHLEYGKLIMFTYRYLSVNCQTKIDSVEFGLGWAMPFRLLVLLGL